MPKRRIAINQRNLGSSNIIDTSSSPLNGFANHFELKNIENLKPKLSTTFKSKLIESNSIFWFKFYLIYLKYLIFAFIIWILILLFYNYRFCKLLKLIYSGIKSGTNKLSNFNLV